MCEVVSAQSVKRLGMINSSKSISLRENIRLYRQVKSPYWWVNARINGKEKRVSTKVLCSEDPNGDGRARTKAFDIAQRLSLEEAFESSKDDIEQNSATLKVVLDYHMAWKNRDIIEIMALFHPEVQYTDFFVNRVMGIKDIPAYIQSCLPKQPGENLTHTDRIRVDGHTAFIQYKLIMKEASYRCSEAITVKEGLIYRIQEYGVLVSKELGGGEKPLEFDRSAISRLGLSAKELANLSQDLQQYFDQYKPFLNPELNLQQVADQTGYSRNQISYFLNKVAGQSFYQYVHQARIEHLLRQIRDGADKNNIDRLALDAGFNSMSAFYKYFKQYTGMSPKAYVKKVLVEEA